MRLQGEGTPDALHSAAAQSGPLGHQATAPVSSLSGGGLQSQSNRTLDFSVANEARRPRARFIEQTVKAFADKSAAPFPNALFAYPYFFSHNHVGFPRGAGQYDPRSLRQGLPRLRPPGPPLQTLAFSVRQHQHGHRSSSTHLISPLCTWTP